MLYQAELRSCVVDIILAVLGVAVNENMVVGGDFTWVAGGDFTPILTFPRRGGRDL